MIPHPNGTRGSPHPLFGGNQESLITSGRRLSKFTCVKFEPTWCSQHQVARPVTDW